jgi:hypothetical protein
MLATIVFQLVMAAGMAVVGWWLYFDEDAPQADAGPGVRESLARLRRRSAA